MISWRDAISDDFSAVLVSSAEILFSAEIIFSAGMVSYFRCTSLILLVRFQISSVSGLGLFPRLRLLLSLILGG